MTRVTSVRALRPDMSLSQRHTSRSIPMPDPTPPAAFDHLVGERLTVDMKELVIAGVEVQDRQGGGHRQLVVSMRARPTRAERYMILVVFADDRGPMWVIQELRKRELHHGCRYDLTTRPS